MERDRERSPASPARTLGGPDGRAYSVDSQVSMSVRGARRGHARDQATLGGMPDDIGEKGERWMQAVVTGPSTIAATTRACARRFVLSLAHQSGACRHRAPGAFAISDLAGRD